MCVRQTNPKPADYADMQARADASVNGNGSPHSLKPKNARLAKEMVSPMMMMPNCQTKPTPVRPLSFSRHALQAESHLRS